MRASDCNVLVRYLIGDDPQQAAKARTVVDAGEVFVSTTVLLESEWVLRSVYVFVGGKVSGALPVFSGLPGESVENPALLGEALDLTEKGMDFADALHLGAADSCKVMVTFDRRFIETAGNTAIQVTEPWTALRSETVTNLPVIFILGTLSAVRKRVLLSARQGTPMPVATRSSLIFVLFHRRTEHAAAVQAVSLRMLQQFMKLDCLSGTLRNRRGRGEALDQVLQGGMPAFSRGRS